MHACVDVCLPSRILFAPDHDIFLSVEISVEI